MKPIKPININECTDKKSLIYMIMKHQNGNMARPLE